MLNWNLIDNDKTFQRLTNHLFAVECDSPGFIPSSPYIGADGSWDGYYKGPYPLEKRDGLFSIQSKWTKKSFDDAYKYLGSVIKKELINAKKKKVEHLRISTNAELRVEHVLNLELLATNKVKTLIIWHRERLTIRIEKQAYLRFLFFKDYQHPALVDSASYYKDIEQHLLSKTLIRPSLDECEHKLERFMGSDSLKIFLLHSSGGCGKSHFLGNIFPILRKVDFQRQVWFVKPSLVNTDTFHAEIVSGRKYLLVIDDADRCVEELRSLLNFLWCSGEDIKIVFGSRSSGVYPLTQVIQEMKCFEVMEQFKIDEWDKDELKELLRLVVGKTPVKDEEEIVHYYPNPYLIVWLGSKIKGKKISEFSVLRRKFVEEITNDTRKCLEGFIKIDIEKFVFTLACITPFYYEDKRIIDKIALYFEVKPDIICAAIERLVAAGILRQVGRTVRFNPDMKGDIYLSYKLESIEEHILKPFILYWIAVVPNNIFVNIG
ncbi:MAG: hypothetical protein HQ521_06695, partial [Bacteroidetes bacterium]|nr:hypothetical protein [Bacteroidota bacterium]